jgi:Tol biopolymer transport system component
MISLSRISIFAMLSLLLLACSSRISADGGGENPEARQTFGVFTNPQPVTIEGYRQDAMEPFISPDGNYLFFNSSNAGPVTNLLYATRIDDVTFQFQGEIAGANSGTLSAVPSMDVNNTFYFVSSRSYPATLSTIYSGTFSNSDGSLSGVALVPGVSKLKPGWVNFDQCISPDGNTLYFVDGFFGSGNFPRTASIAIATRDGDHFVRVANSAEIMRQVNKHGLNYAADISKSGLEFFFTRVPSIKEPPPAIYTTTRASTSEPFGKPVRIKAITGFAEAPALSPDERSLYYHERMNGVFVIYRVTRP